MTVRMNYVGPLFDGRAPGIIDGAIKDAIDEALGRGEELVKEQLYEGHGVVTGHYRRSVRGERDDSRHGTVHDSQVVYGPWLEGVSSRNASGRFRGYSMFRNARQQLEREAPRILEHNIERAVSRLNGGFSF
jgi:hypothetical protein